MAQGLKKKEGPAPIPSRRRPRPAGDEEAAATLKLGEMRSSDAISVPGADVLIKGIEKSRQENNRPFKHNDITAKMTQYMETFSRFKGNETVNAVVGEATTLGGVLASFELAQLVSLSCDTADEARTLIPSLEGKIEDDELQVVLDNISRLRNFT